jgi:transcriptional repressor NrdR
MRCPFCGSEDTQVKDSRPVEDGTSIRRRRSCGTCGARFTTFERVQLRDLVVVKKDGRRVPFDREKLVRSLTIATRKRGIDEDAIERMANGIVRRIETAGEGEVESERIGELAMEALAAVDEVAYVRFASVYRDFATARDFDEFIRRLPANARRQAADAGR